MTEASFSIAIVTQEEKGVRCMGCSSLPRAGFAGARGVELELEWGHPQPSGPPKPTGRAHGARGARGSYKSLCKKI